MARSLVRETVRADDGSVIVGARVYPLLEGTATALPDAFAASVGGAAITSVVSNVQGEVEFWTNDAYERVSLRVTDNGGTAYRAGRATRPIEFPDFTETVPVGETASHAASHASGMADEIEIAKGQVIGLIESLTDTATLTQLFFESGLRVSGDAALDGRLDTLEAIDSVPALGNGQADVTAAVGRGAGAGTAIGDKIALYEGLYGFGLQAFRVVVYTSGGAGLAVRVVNFGPGAVLSSGSDAVVLHDDGDIESCVAGKGLILKSANGTRYRVIVQNDGTIDTEAV